jgi:uncharacterized membrane protein
MTGLPLIFLIITLVISANGLLIGWFDKKTMYNGVELHYYSDWLVLSCVCFCVLMIPFIKPLREYRKDTYIKNSIRRYEFWDNALSKYGGKNPSWEHDKYINQKRYLKLKELQKKYKRNKLWNYFHI